MAKGQAAPSYGVSPPDSVHTTALSSTQSLEHIRTFWQRIWDRPVVCRRAAVQKWRGYGRPRPCNFQPAQVWSAEVLHKIALTKASSSPGIDGWRGDEIKYWPHRAWVAYSELLCRCAGGPAGEPTHAPGRK